MATAQPNPLEDADEIIDTTTPALQVAQTDDEDDGSTPDTPEQLAAAEAARQVALKQVAAPETPPLPDLHADPTARQTGIMVPKQRLDEVYARSRELEVENETLRIAAAAVAKPVVPEVPPFDLDKAEAERLAALASGDDAVALQISKTINAHILETATKNAIAAMRQDQQAQVQATQETELAQAVKDVVLLYPQLDAKSEAANVDAMLFCRGKRDQLIDQGQPWGAALRAASDATAKLFGFDAPPPEVKDPKTPAPNTPALRLVEARRRNAAALASQPPDLVGGVGNRGAAGVRLDPRTMSDAELNALPAAELQKLDGST